MTKKPAFSTRIISIGILLSLFASGAFAQVSNSIAAIDLIFSEWDKVDSPGMAVAVVRNGEIIFENGYGMATLEYEVPITPETVFHVASVSKQFTAFAALLLAERGKISLDADIRSYLPEFPDFGHAITIRHLIHHTSGLRDQWELLGLAGWRLDDVITHDHIMRLVDRQHTLNFVPGEEYLYCNTGYTLIAEIIRRVTGRTLSEWSAEHIFAPLEMTNTQFYDDHERIVTNRAYSYRTDENGEYRKAVLSYANAGATSLFTTARDMARWAVNFDQISVGSTHVIHQMYQRGRLNSGDTLQYASGLMESAFRGARIVGHGGADAGYRSYFGVFPDHDLTVIVLSNVASAAPQRLAMQVADVFLHGMIGEPSTQWHPIQRQERNVRHVSLSDLRSYEGTFYSNELQTAYRIIADSTGLRAVHGRHGDIMLFPGDTDQFYGDAWFFRAIQFETNEDGMHDRFYVTNGRIRNVVFRRMPDGIF